MTDRVQPVSFEAFLRAWLRAELASLGIATTIAPIFSSERRELYPPGRYSDDARKAKRAACDRIKRVPDAKKKGPGIYEVEREVYAAHYAAAPNGVALSPRRSLSTGDSDDLAGVSAALEACGLRATKRAS